jgi:hypothetical protein
MALYYVSWKVLSTGYTGRGSAMSFELASVWAKRMNEKYPDIDHLVLQD